MEVKLPGTQRGDKRRLEWRWGGTRNGKTQGASFDTADAEKAWGLVLAAGREITAEELYQLMIGEEVQLGEEQPSAIPTFSGMFPHFINSKPRRDPITNKGYWSHYNCELGKHFGHVRVDKITQDEVAKFIKYLDRVKNTQSTVDSYHATLHAALEYAVSKGYLLRNVSDKKLLGLDRKRGRHFDVIDPGEKKRMYLTTSEFEMIARNSDDYARPLIELLVGSGLRISEAVALDIQDIEWDTNRIHVFKQVANMPDDEEDNAVPLSGVPGYKATKNRQTRWVTLEDSVMLWLKVVIGDRKPGIKPGDTPIFLSPDGKKWEYDNFLKRHWNTAVGAAMRCAEHPPPLPPKPPRGPRRNWRPEEVSDCQCAGRLRRRPTPHQLRHTHATWLLSDGWTIAQVSRRLGHSSIKVTDDIYSDFTSEKDAELIEAFGKRRAEARSTERTRAERNVTSAV